MNKKLFIGYFLFSLCFRFELTAGGDLDFDNLKIDLETIKNVENEFLIKKLDAFNKQEQKSLVKGLDEDKVEVVEERSFSNVNDNKLQEKKKFERHFLNKESLDFYKYPAFPPYALPYDKNNLVFISVGSLWANKCFSPSGSCHNMAENVFKANHIYLKDILTVSKLLKNSLLSSTGGSGTPFVHDDTKHYFYQLADQELKFNASFRKTFVNFSLQHFFEKIGTSLGIMFPVVNRKNNIVMESKMSVAMRNNLSTYTPQFFDNYENLEDFFDHILQAKGIGYNKHDSEVGFGDLTFFANTSIKDRHFQSLILGAKVVAPTSYREGSADRLWNPDLGNGGFWEIGAFFSGYKKVDDNINPNFFFEFSLPLPSNLYKRIPQRKIYDGVTPAPGANVGDKLLMGGTDVQFKNAYNVLDSDVAMMADQSVGIKMKKGSQIVFRFGNVIDKFLSRKSFLDIYYEFRGKNRDYASRSNFDTNYDTINLNKNSFEAEHKIAANFLYQFSHFKRMAVGCIYTIYGRNVPKTLEFNISFNKDF
ncbi:TPA: hypothetical protein DEO28_00015 [Candidatus Dependentiae bacterium]|nr:hypothetical protein [Candidatus Dependentiae bacterium]HBZ72889.1 hypothetical protein [Candidatus Dependentiae bacterium]